MDNAPEVDVALTAFIGSLDQRQSAYLDGMRTRDRESAATALLDLESGLASVSESVDSSMAAVAEEVTQDVGVARSLIGAASRLIPGRRLPSRSQLRPGSPCKPRRSGGRRLRPAPAVDRGPRCPMSSEVTCDPLSRSEASTSSAMDCTADPDTGRSAKAAEIPAASFAEENASSLPLRLRTISCGSSRS